MLAAITGTVALRDAFLWLQTDALK